MQYRFMRFPEGRGKAVTFSYDDGPKTDLKLAKICNKFGIRCTFNLCKALDGASENALNIEEIRNELLCAGHEIAVHGHEHKAPANCTDIEIIRDVLCCREELEAAFDRIVRGMAYPDVGIRTVSNERYFEIRELLKGLGITYARTLGQDNNGFRLPEDFYAWMPTAHHENPDVLDYAREFCDLDIDSLYPADRYPRLFFLWGHSWEFERNNNWGKAEEICTVLGNREDVWYATNSEIFDYVQGYNSLVFSANGSRVYNPALFPVWFATRDMLYCVKAGEEINLNA